MTRGALLNPLYIPGDNLVQPVSATRDELDQCNSSLGLDGAYRVP
jgi:hypothetical protein